jgi:SAM-dependent methyltransferase
MSHALPPSYFERVYQDNDDPWGFESRWYEQRKYALSLAALPKPRYTRAFEPGCAIGVLSALLAARCDELIASELHARVAERARARLASFPHVRVDIAAIPDAWPEGSFDLLVMSEVLYYLTHDGWRVLVERIADSTRSGAHLLAVHYRGETDYPQTAESVHMRLQTLSDWKPIAHYEEPSFLLDVLERSKS